MPISSFSSQEMYSQLNYLSLISALQIFLIRSVLLLSSSSSLKSLCSDAQSWCSKNNLLKDLQPSRAHSSIADWALMFNCYRKLTIWLKWARITSNHPRKLRAALSGYNQRTPYQILISWNGMDCWGFAFCERIKLWRQPSSTRRWFRCWRLTLTGTNKKIVIRWSSSWGRCSLGRRKSRSSRREKVKRWR